MADVTWQIDEIRYIVQPEQTDLYVFISVSNLLDSPHFIPGWHYKKLPPTQAAAEFLTNSSWHSECMFWPEVMPPERPYETRLQRLLRLQEQQSDPEMKEALQMSIDTERTMLEKGLGQ